MSTKGNSLSLLIDELLKQFLPDEDPRPEGSSGKIVRDAVWGMISLRPHEVALVDTPLFQRLRGIFQTGFTYLVYPCAVHSRFEHSLGCFHLASRVIQAVNHNQAAGDDAPKITPAEEGTVRIAALLHDIAHCVFSHVSETIYERDPLVNEAREKVRKLFPKDLEKKYVGAGEVLAYNIITSARFKSYFRKILKACGVRDDINPENIARLIVGLPPKEHQDRLYLPQIINGPFDVDKLDYQSRDGHFTGIAIPVDTERLLASLCLVRDDENRWFLAIDHRGVAAIEQMLFNRMLLYDSVYHHHKVRAAVKLFQSETARVPLKLSWLLLHDEYDFYGFNETPKGLSKLITKLRRRQLPYRALVLHRTTINGGIGKWHEMILRAHSPDEADKSTANRWFKSIERRIASGVPAIGDGVYLDVPKPPEFQILQRGTYIKMTGREKLVLDQLFPITSTINSYAQQCKYRAYLFAPRDKQEAVAIAAYKVFKAEGIQLNQEAFRLARIDPNIVTKGVGGLIPKAEIA